MKLICMKKKVFPIDYFKLCFISVQIMWHVVKLQGNACPHIEGVNTTGCYTWKFWAEYSLTLGLEFFQFSEQSAPLFPREEDKNAYKLVDSQHGESSFSEEFQC